MNETFVKKELLKECYILLEEIYSIIKSNNKGTKYIGALQGGMGEVLFLTIAKKTLKKDNEKLIAKKIKYIESLINKSTITLSYINGFVGFANSIVIILEEDDDETAINKKNILIGIDESMNLVYEELLQSEQIDLDLFYGLIGIGKYFLSRTVDTNIPTLESVVSLILNESILEDDKRHWGKGKRIEFGLAHGQTMFLKFLFDVHLILGEKIVSKKVLYEIINFILFYNQSGEFPDEIENNKLLFSPHRWCHGSLSIALIIGEVAMHFKDQQLINIYKKAIEISLASPPEIHDLGFCHGAFGVAYLYYKNIKLDFTESTAEKFNEWLKYSLDKVKENELKVLEFDNGILQGIEGIGLILISIIDDENDLNWSKLVQI